MTETFEIGDVVYLKSGGVAMTVTNISDAIEVHYNKTGEIRYSRLPAAALTKTNPKHVFHGRDESE